MIFKEVVLERDGMVGKLEEIQEIQQKDKRRGDKLQNHCNDLEFK